MARILGCNRMTALGVACSWFRYIDMFTTDGRTHLTPDELDEELGFRGSANALSLVVWAALDDEGCVVAPNFDEHCGETAKRRAEDARRQQKSRVTKKCDTPPAPLSQKNVTHVAEPVTKKCDQRREEKNREEKTLSVEETLMGNNTQQGVLPLTSNSRPADPQEVHRFLTSQPHTMLPQNELLACAEKFFLSGQASGWLYKNAPLSDWKASARLWLTRWQENYRKKAKQRSGASLNANIYG